MYDSKLEFFKSFKLDSLVKIGEKFLKFQILKAYNFKHHKNLTMGLSKQSHLKVENFKSSEF